MIKKYGFVMEIYTDFSCLFPNHAAPYFNVNMIESGVDNALFFGL